MIKDFDPSFKDFKVRCSAISMVLSNSRSNPCLTDLQGVRLKELEAKDKLTDKQTLEMADLLVKKENSKKVILSDTCISYLMTEYAWKKEGMVSVTRELLDIPQMQKGTIVEPQSLALLSLVDGVYYFANEDENGNRERIYNEYLSGEVDAHEGETIIGSKCIPDIKSIFDLPTFLCKIVEPLTVANDWQIKGYMDISGAPEGFVANCLVDTDDGTIDSIKYRLLSKMRVATEEDPKFKERWGLLERSMRFSHIAPHQRVFKKKVEPMTEDQRTFLYDRVKVCREWLSNFHEQYQKLNKK
jgi:hypothetical protein